MGTSILGSGGITSAREKVQTPASLGTYLSSDGSKYEGVWKSNKKSGKGTSRCTLGTLQYANTEKYEGEWKNDKRDGVGVFHHENGDRYEGHYVAGQRSGKGRFGGRE